jgi:hypothetical protein
MSTSPRTRPPSATPSSSSRHGRAFAFDGNTGRGHRRPLLAERFELHLTLVRLSRLSASFLGVLSPATFVLPGSSQWRWGRRPGMNYSTPGGGRYDSAALVCWPGSALKLLAHPFPQK